MWNTFQIEDKFCHIYEKGQAGPVFLWAYFPHEGDELSRMEADLEERLPDGSYVIAAYEIDDWNRDLSPWKAPMAMGDEIFQGEGSCTLQWVIRTFLPWLRQRYSPSGKYYMMGYSLAGLFSLWSLYETECFDGAVCCSGSLWMEGWDKYVSRHKVKSPVIVYLSLGGKEEKTHNPVMAAIGNRTREQEKILREDPSVKKCILEWNGGGHFADSIKRLVKGWYGSEIVKDVCRARQSKI